MLEALKRQVLEANLALVQYQLVTLTWGNASGIARNEGLVVIKPSGVPYDELGVDDLVVVNLSGTTVEGTRRPSSDTPTHIELYKAFPVIGGIAHSHSLCATSFAQAGREIPCLGTTHADAFNGPIPVTRLLSREEVEDRYERNTGRVIVERFRTLDPLSMPAVLLPGHAPFTWGHDATDAVENSFVLERVAQMALQSLALNPGAAPIPDYLLKKHQDRKHGPGAYYGQPQ